MYAVYEFRTNEQGSMDELIATLKKITNTTEDGELINAAPCGCQFRDTTSCLDISADL